MKIKKNIVFIYDSGKKIGSGHFGRCLNFSKYISKIYPDYKFYFISKDKTFSKKILNKKNKFLFLKKNNYKILLGILKSIDPRYIFIDSYLLSFFFKKKIYDNFKNTIIIEDQIKSKQIGKIYINYNYNSIEKTKNQILKFEKKFIGYKYFIKNTKYLNYKPKKLNGIRRILIYFGSTKNTILLKNVLNILSNEKFNKINFKIVLGKFENYNFKKNFSKKNFYFFKDLSNEDFLKISSTCQLSIGSGGVSCWERIFLGLINFVIVTAKNQSYSSNQMSKLKYIHKLGTKGKISNKLLTKKLNQDIFNHNLIKSIYGKSSNILLKNEVSKIINYLKLE